MEIRERFVLRVFLLRTPFHKQTHSQSAKHSKYPYPIRVAYPTQIVVFGNVQALMQSAFNTPTQTVELEPVHGFESLRLQTAYEPNAFFFPPTALTNQLRRLCRHRKTDRFSAHRTGFYGSTFRTALVAFHGSGLLCRRFQRGKNQPRGLVQSAGLLPAVSAGSF